jgi:uncharacterized membrane protein YbaN (DUF454 family)
MDRRRLLVTAVRRAGWAVVGIGLPADVEPANGPACGAVSGLTKHTVVTAAAADDVPRPAAGRLRRWVLATIGVALVAVAAAGVFLPGLPTTVFLLGASWCFARSCPWLEERLIRVPLFRPFLVYLDGGARMPRRAVIWTLVVMWTAIAVSAVAVNLGEQARPLLAAMIVAAGLVGSWYVLRLRGGRTALIEAADPPGASDATAGHGPADRRSAGRPQPSDG